MTFYLIFQVINILLIVLSFYMVLRLYDHLEQYENRALFLVLTGVVLDIIGQFSVSHCDTIEAAGVGLRLAISGRATFGFGFILYVIKVFNARHKRGISAIWALSIFGAFIHCFMLGKEHMFLANPEIFKFYGVSVLRGERGPLYYLMQVTSIALALWTILLAFRKISPKKGKVPIVEKRVAYTYIHSISTYIFLLLLSELLFGKIPAFSALVRVIGIFVFYRYAVKYTFENYDALEHKALLDDVGAGFLVMSTNYEVRYANGPARRLLDELKLTRKDSIESILKQSVARREFQANHNGTVYKVVANRVYSRGKLNGYSLLLTDISDIVQLEKRAEQNSLARTRLLSNISHELRTPLNAITQAAEFIENKELGVKEISEYADVIKNGAININDMLGNYLEMSSEKSIVNDIELVPYNVCALIESVVDLCNERTSHRRLNFSISLSPKLPLNTYGDEARTRQVLTTVLTNAIKFTDEGSINLKVSGEWFSEDEYEYEYLVTDLGANSSEIDSAIEKTFSEEWSESTDIATGYEISLYVIRKLVNDIGGDISVRSANGKGIIYRFRVKQKIINSETLIGYDFANKLDLICCGEKTEHISELLAACGEFDIHAENVSGIQHLRKQKAEDVKKHILMYSFDKHEKRMHLSERAKNYVKVAVLQPGQVPTVYDPEVIYVHKPLSILTLRRILLHIEEKEKTGLYFDRFTAPGATVLVVDDNTLNIELAYRMLEQYKMTIDTVSNGYDALDKITSGRKYDIIFMDYMMDGIDGAETTLRIRAMGDEFKTIPIIGFSANNVSGARDLYVEAGMDDVIFKPATKSDIENALRKYLPKELLVFEAGKPSFEIPTEPFPEIEGADSQTAAKYVGNNIKVYKDMLASFALDIEGREKMILDYLERKDFRNFVIQTHAVKGIARTLGMLELSERMAIMEQAGKEEDKDYIYANLSELLSYYRKFTKILIPFVEEKEKASSKIVVSDQVGEVLIKIHEVLEDFEIGEAEKLFYTIWPGEYSAERSELMKGLKEALELADYYESLDYVERLIETYNVK